MIWGAAAYVASPLWSAAIVHEPALNNVTVEPDTEQTLDIAGTVVNATGRPEVAVPVNGIGIAPYVCVAGPVKLMLCDVPTIVSVKFWVAAGAVVLSAVNVTG